MNLHAVRGDIAVEAPKVAEVAVLWVRNGVYQGPGNYRKFTFNVRFGNRLTWLIPVKVNVRSGCQVEQPADLDTPWKTNADQILAINPPEGQLQFLYVFSNPTNRVGIPEPGKLEHRIRRSLETAAKLGIRKIAMTSIPLAVSENGDRIRPNAESARAMIEAVTAWDSRHPGLVDDIYLIDTRNGFAKQINRRESASRCVKSIALVNERVQTNQDNSTTAG